MEIVHCDLFATRIWIMDLSQLSLHFDGWRSEIERLRSSDMASRGKSNRKGWNSQPMIMSLPIFKPLLEGCAKAFSCAIKTVSPKRDYLYSLEAWANVHDVGGFNILHSHPGALMSGTFYLTVPKGAGELIFRDPRQGVVLSEFYGNQTPNASSDLKLLPKEGMLVLFPSWLEHRVEPHEGDVPRGFNCHECTTGNTDYLALLR